LLIALLSFLDLCRRLLSTDSAANAVAEVRDVPILEPSDEVELDAIAAEVGGTVGGPTGRGPSVAAVVRFPRRGA
jgi:hypothetical protein